jgi:hypothetical protein
MTVQELAESLSALAEAEPDTEVRVGILEHYEGGLQTEPFGHLAMIDGKLVIGGFAWNKVRKHNPDSTVEHTNPY